MMGSHTTPAIVLLAPRIGRYPHARGRVPNISPYHSNQWRRRAQPGGPAMAKSRETGQKPTPQFVKKEDSSHAHRGQTVSQSHKHTVVSTREREREKERDAPLLRWLSRLRRVFVIPTPSRKGGGGGSSGRGGAVER
ncbi:hypothetical protein Sjap_011924 [Stephania japonica]|uniref:Uncharacterized protein n=1 Tax=Stephania japonica TaxID=461633 RepID=A0AAP0P546_9MAGN